MGPWNAWYDCQSIIANKLNQVLASTTKYQVLFLNQTSTTSNWLWLQLSPVVCMFECECTLKTRERRQLIPWKSVFTVAFVCDNKTSERRHMKQKIAAAANKVEFFMTTRSLHKLLFFRVNFKPFVLKTGMNSYESFIYSLLTISALRQWLIALFYFMKRKWTSISFKVY